MLLKSGVTASQKTPYGEQGKNQPNFQVAGSQRTVFHCLPNTAHMDWCYGVCQLQRRADQTGSHSLKAFRISYFVGLSL